MINLPYIPTEVIVAADMSANITSDKIQMGPDKNMGLQFIWTGTPTGTFGVSVSNDDGNTFTSLSLSGVTNPAGSGGTYWLDLVDINPDMIEVTYTASTGAGRLNVFALAKL